MISRRKLYLHSEVIKFVNSLTDTQVAALYWIFKSFGSVRTASALQYDIKVLFENCGD